MEQGFFAVPTWDGVSPIIPCAGWSESQAWYQFDRFVMDGKEGLLGHRGLLERFNKLTPCFSSRKKFYKRIGVSVIVGRYVFDGSNAIVSGLPLEKG